MMSKDFLHTTFDVYISQKVYGVHSRRRCYINLNFALVLSRFWLVSRCPSFEDFEPAASCKPADSEAISYCRCHMLTRMRTILNCASSTSELEPPSQAFHNNTKILAEDLSTQVQSRRRYQRLR